MGWIRARRGASVPLGLFHIITNVTAPRRHVPPVTVVISVSAGVGRQPDRTGPPTRFVVFSPMLCNQVSVSLKNWLGLECSGLKKQKTLTGLSLLLISTKCSLAGPLFHPLNLQSVSIIPPHEPHTLSAFVCFTHQHTHRPCEGLKGNK